MSLEEAIEVGADECHCPPETMHCALLLMMPAIRAAIIDECARVAEEHDIGQGWGDAIAAAIRALKDKPFLEG